MNDTQVIEPPVVIMMQLANGDTRERYCREVCASILNSVVDDTYFYDDEGEPSMEFVSEYIDWLDGQISMLGYYAWWDCGDVVVYDLNGFTEEEREAFYEQMQNC